MYSSGKLLYMSVYDFLLGLTSELDNNIRGRYQDITFSGPETCISMHVEPPTFF